MKLLLDTHALLWWLNDSPRLNGKAHDLIGDPENVVYASIVSLWEIAVKARIGKLDADPALIARKAMDGGLELLGILLTHLTTLKSLPDHHRDPFDHLLIAQAIAEDATFVSNDRHAVRYGVRHIACTSSA
ncbi:MAG: type II toxin-antitoxin system VapC family toxin [Acetobacteraceae bacterium]|nr:type II toxin-antitoxin system VapC family toxin [Acetobacteraceae bacterium]